MSSTQEKAAVYAYFVGFKDPSKINIDLAAQNAGVSKMSALAILGKMKTEPATYGRLLSMGYPKEKIPEWIARPEPTPPVDAPAASVDASVDPVNASVAPVDVRSLRPSTDATQRASG